MLIGEEERTVDEEEEEEEEEGDGSIVDGSCSVGFLVFSQAEKESRPAVYI